jgi:hypothetical protein
VLERGSPARQFLRNFAEMLLAMVLGMAVFGSLLRGISAAPAAASLAMAVSMTLPMAAWMRHRGHAWARVAEMAGAMFLPAIVLVLLLLAGVVTGQPLLDIQHAAMVPGMLAVMLLRRREYSRGRTLELTPF